MNTALHHKIQVLEMIDTETVLQPPLACRATWWKNGIDSIIEPSNGITNDTQRSMHCYKKSFCMSLTLLTKDDSVATLNAPVKIRQNSAERQSRKKCCLPHVTV